MFAKVGLLVLGLRKPVPSSSSCHRACFIGCSARDQKTLEHVLARTKVVSPRAPKSQTEVIPIELLVSQGAYS